MFLSYGSEITGVIAKSDLDRYPAILKESILESVRIKKVVDGNIYFSIPDRITAENLDRSVRRYENNRNRAESRRMNLSSLSSGIFEKEDIESLFVAQEGLCYYTGETLVSNPKNYSIDHVVSVIEGGSSWPSNLVLATIQANRKKHIYSKNYIFSVLRKEHGKEWLKAQRQFCRKVDRKRLLIDKNRRKVVSENLINVECELKFNFPDIEIKYALAGDEVELVVENTVVQFPAGFLRDSRKAYSFQYIMNLVAAIIAV